MTAAGGKKANLKRGSKMKFGNKAVAGSKTSTFVVGESYQAYEHRVDELINH